MKERSIRIGLIKYFAEAEKAFPFNATHFDAAETYLNNTDERTRLTSGDQTLARKLSNMIAVDVETQVIHKGVQAVTEILKAVGGFVATVNTPFYQADKEAIEAIVSEPGLLPVLNSGNKLSQPEMVPSIRCCASGTAIVYRKLPHGIFISWMCTWQ